MDPFPRRVPAFVLLGISPRIAFHIPVAASAPCIERCTQDPDWQSPKKSFASLPRAWQSPPVPIFLSPRSLPFAPVLAGSPRRKFARQAARSRFAADRSLAFAVAVVDFRCAIWAVLSWLRQVIGFPD